MHLITSEFLDEEELVQPLPEEDVHQGDVYMQPSSPGNGSDTVTATERTVTATEGRSERRALSSITQTASEGDECDEEIQVGSAVHRVGSDINFPEDENDMINDDEDVGGQGEKSKKKIKVNRNNIHLRRSQVLNIAAHMEGVAKKEDEDDAAIEELEEIMNSVVCDIKVTSQDIPYTSRKRTYERQDPSMFFPKAKKRGRRRIKAHERLEGTLSEVQKGLVHQPKDREW